MTASAGPQTRDIQIDRGPAAPALAEQVFATLRQAILDGRIEPGARLPSWRDLAAQLGVGRGTVQAAYERLSDHGLVVSSGAAGTRAASLKPSPPPALRVQPPLQTLVHRFSAPCLAFQTGVPAEDAFPAGLWARCLSHAARQDAHSPTSYPDPRGLPDLRAQIASHLAIARGISCVPDQVIVTGSFRAGLALAMQVVGAAGRRAWMEDPGFPLTRMGLEDAGAYPVPIRVDDQGLDVAHGEALAPDAAVAVVTPGQHAPTGVALSPARREALLAWAARADAWIIEDDYLSELQLTGRAAPALAARDPTGRVIHIGSFSKTLKPALGLGFIVAPAALAQRFGQLAATLAPTFNPVAQAAMALMLADGHYMRHLRHMKRLYAHRLEALQSALGGEMEFKAGAGPQVRLRLPVGTDDVAMARAGPDLGVAPTALSPWYADPSRTEPSLLLSVTNLGEARLAEACKGLRALVAGA
ncbi:GntR family transcriptional regulator [Caulobacter sp. Root656]|nr:GntR family transcriptional regulator [Caulobacter sp. Root656]